MINTELLIVAEELKYNSRSNNRAQLAAVNLAIQKLVVEQEALMGKFSLRDVEA
jgi:hypothetical protein